MMWTSTEYINTRIAEIAGTIHRTLHIVQFLDDPVIASFVRKKLSLARSLGVTTMIHQHYDMTESNAVSWLHQLVQKHPMDGFIIQLPLPPSWNRLPFLELIPIRGDVDILSDSAYHRWIVSEQILVQPPIIYAVSTALSQCIALDSLQDHTITVCGSGMLVGKPIQDWLTKLSIPYHVIDHTTEPFERRQLLSKATVILSGMGAPWSITESDITAGVVIIDCGTSSDAGTLQGDVHPNCDAVAGSITATPRGIGPLTVLGVFENLRNLDHDLY